MGSRPLRMKVRWGCPPQVLSPPPHRTQSWRPCLPRQPWASGWRSTDRPVPSPRGWTIGFSERGVAHNRALPRCLYSRRCMRSWRVRGWPLSRPEAARPPPPSSLPSMAEWPGDTRAFPRWRERSQCTCAHETPSLGGTVRVSRPRPVSWQPLSQPKLTVLRARQPPPLKLYVAAIAAHHDAVDGRSLGKHDLIVRFLKGARRMNPSRPRLVPSWDLSIVLAGLQRGPFEPLDSVELKFLSLKTALLTALTSIKRVGDLQAFSVSEECLVFGQVYSHVVLRPRPGYVPKVPTTPFRDQVVDLQALPSEEADPALALLCPVRALRIYVTAAIPWDEWALTPKGEGKSEDSRL